MIQNKSIELDFYIDYILGMIYNNLSINFKERWIYKMKKQELIDYLVDTYHEDKNELKNMKKDELEEILENYEDHSDMFPNDDEFDGSHEWD